jgi:3-oxoadipate enol-lactonase
MAGARFVDVRGTRVFVEEWGAGPTLLCVHGLGGGSHFFGALGYALATRWRTLALDLPGSGLSPLTADFSFDSLAELLVSLARIESESKVCLLGHSMGAILALEAVRQAPELAAGFIAVGGLSEALPESRSRIRARNEEIQHSGMAGRGEGFASVNLARRTQQERPEITGVLAKLFDLQPARGYTAAAEALASWTARPLPPLERVRCLAITGVEDRYAPPAAVQEFAGALPAGTGFEVMPDCGHLPFLEQPAAFAAIVKGFLETVVVGSG